MKNNAIAVLKEIKLVNKIMKLLAGETGLHISNEDEKDKLKKLAKFIIHLCKSAKNENEFTSLLIQNDGEFSQDTITSLFKTIKEDIGEQSQPSMRNNNNNLLDVKEENDERKNMHFKNAYLTEDSKENIKKTFTALAIPNKNKEELDIELGVIFDIGNNTTHVMSYGSSNVNGDNSRIKINKNLSPIRFGNNKERSRESSPQINVKQYNQHKTTSNSNNSSVTNRYAKQEIFSELKQNGIYNGIVTRVESYGCFVLLDISRSTSTERSSRYHNSSKQKPFQGFVHISQMKTIDYKSKNRISSAHSLVKIKDKVKVKVLSLENNKITLSMNQVDQITGEDLGIKLTTSNSIAPSLPVTNDLLSRQNPYLQLPKEDNKRLYGELTGIALDTETKTGKQMSSPELWELNQMKNAKAFDYVYDPIMRMEVNNSFNDYTTEEYIDIELKEEEPPFLKGQTAKAGINFSPIRIVKNPDGTMHRAAIQQAEQAKNRRELRELQNKSLLDKNKSTNTVRDILNLNYNNPNIDYSKTNILPRDPAATPLLQPRKFHATSRSILSMKEQRETLPIFQLKPQLMKMIAENRIIVVIGETGSGKTTQITQYLVEAKYAQYGKIGCTQPRRVAAMSVAKRVSEEFGCKLGEFVGYCVRFEDCCSEDTIIKYMTDGMLLREALIDKNLTQYSVIMLDEAHERTIHTDILFGLLKEALRQRNELKLIVTSATLDSEKFSKFFGNCPIFRIPGRTFDVEIFYAKEPEYDYMEAALITVMQIHLTEGPGDILVFLTGQEEIETACQILTARMKALGKGAKPLLVLPVYSALPSEMQTKIFEPAPYGTRKCIIATNIAEASLTIDGIYYVVDPGFAKIKAYNSKIGMDSLMIAPISQSSAMQRAGRAGRTGPGKCYRLYTYDAYTNDLLKATIPEIQRTNLANTVLLLKALGINDLINFEFMDPPPLQTLIAAMIQLYYLGALDEEGLLTKLGRRMAEFPLEPQLSKMLLTSVDLGCSEEIITIVSMLSVQNIFYRPRDKQAEADQKKTKFIHPDGDHLTLLTVFEMWKKNHSSQWCMDNFIHYRAMRKAEDIKKQLIAIMDRYRLPVVSCKNDLAKVRKAITAGFFVHVARKDPHEGYKTLVDNQTIFIHPSSALFNKSPEWVVYHELVLTSKEYMREITTIDAKWLVDVAGKFFKKCNPNVLSKRQRCEKIEPLQNKYEDPNAWRLSKRRGIIY